MLATLCSKPEVMNSQMGKKMPSILPGLAAGAPAEPDRQTDQPVAHQAQVEGGQKVKGDLTGGDAQGHAAKHPGRRWRADRT